MAEGSAGNVVRGSRQLSITHSHSLKGCLQCSCPVSLCFAVPYFILSMLKHCSNASPTAHTHMKPHSNLLSHYVPVNMLTVYQNDSFESKQNGHLRASFILWRPLKCWFPGYFLLHGALHGTILTLFGKKQMSKIATDLLKAQYFSRVFTVVYWLRWFQNQKL